MLARTVLAELTACIVLAGERQGKLQEPEFVERVGQLRTLVGPMNAAEFASRAKALWKSLNKDAISPYLKAKFKEGIKSIKKIPKRKDYDELWVENQLLPPLEENWLSDEELWGWISQFENDEQVAAIFMKCTLERGLSKTVEDLGGAISEDELVRKIREMDFTMSELRLLQLVLELLSEFTVTKTEVPENPPFEMPRGESDG